MSGDFFQIRSLGDWIQSRMWPLKWLYARSLGAHPGRQDLEYLIALFESKLFGHDQDLMNKTHRLLNASRNRFVPFLYMGQTAGDAGFAEQFRDPHPDSSNQVGHFLTALALGFRPEVEIDRVIFIASPPLAVALPSIRDVLGENRSTPLREIAARLIVGHEKEPDFDARNRNPFSFHIQYRAATTEEIRSFFQAGDCMSLDPGCWNAVCTCLEEIPIDVRKSGNSIQDMRLSLVGFWLGEQIRQGAITESATAARVLRTFLQNENGG
ncbi:MAG: hypothetical protein KDK34_03380 [Leptospiraceae bacterium]|nr:hypothetical protein [Leptospiraceae bacterium]